MQKLLFETGKEEAASSEAASNRRAAARPLVLVVEDNLDMGAYLNEILSGEFQLEAAKDGLEGLAKAKEMLPSLILSDVMMPRMGGEELCRAVKSDKKL